MRCLNMLINVERDMSLSNLSEFCQQKLVQSPELTKKEIKVRKST